MNLDNKNNLISSLGGRNHKPPMITMQDHANLTTSGFNLKISTTAISRKQNFATTVCLSKKLRRRWTQPKILMKASRI